MSISKSVIDAFLKALRMSLKVVVCRIPMASRENFWPSQAQKQTHADCDDRLSDATPLYVTSGGHAAGQQAGR